MRTNKKNIRDYKKTGIQFAYILDSINNDEYTLTDDIEKIAYFFDMFNKQFNYNNNKIEYPNLQKRIEEFLRDIPSCINILFWNDDIIKLGKSWGFCQNEKKEESFLLNYWNTMAFRLIQIANYYKFDLSKFY